MDPGEHGNHNCHLCMCSGDHTLLFSLPRPQIHEKYCMDDLLSALNEALKFGIPSDYHSLVLKIMILMF